MDNNKENDPATDKNKKINVYFCVAYSRYFSTSTHRVIVKLKNNVIPLGRGSIPAKVGFWVGLRIFSYVPTPTKLTNATSKTQLSGPKKGVFSPKIPRKCPFFCFWRVLAVFSGLKPAE